MSTALKRGEGAVLDGLLMERTVARDVSAGRARARQHQHAMDSGALFRRHAGFVASFLFRSGIARGELDDLVQEVFMNAHRRGGYRPGPASARTFLARLALEARLGHIRRHARWHRTQADPQLESHSTSPLADPEQWTHAQQTAEQMQCILDEMQDGPRTVFVLFELEGESGHAIAAGLGIKLGTVYSRLHEARRVFSQQTEASS